jgi:hypothetical protein
MRISGQGSFPVPVRWQHCNVELSSSADCCCQFAIQIVGEEWKYHNCYIVIKLST